VLQAFIRRSVETPSYVSCTVTSRCTSYCFPAHVATDHLWYFQVAVRAAPYRRDFYTRISQGAPIEKLDAELGKWLSGLDVIVKRLKGFIEGEGYGRI
jgi:hypothetical protein